MTTNLTPQQQAALNAYDRSVSLAAGAGCGKTFVLTERFLSYIDPLVIQPAAELKQLVAITFTDAAAREMRRRIRQRCWSRLTTAATAEEAAAWQRLLRAIDSARISTIHSFCAALLRQNAVEAGLDPQFEQLEPAAADLLRIETIDDTLRRLLIDRDERVLDLAVHFGLAQLRRHLMKLVGDTPATFWEKWSEATSEEVIAAWQQAYVTEFVPLLHQDLLELPALKELEELIAEAVPATEKLLPKLGELQDAIHDVRNVPASSAPWQTVHDCANAKGATSKNHWADEEQKDRYGTLCEKVRNAIKKSLLQTFELTEESQEYAQRGLDLLAIATEIRERYESAKRQSNQLEFDDLLERTYQLLTSEQHPAIRQRLAQETQLLMVDEFQDTDPLQVAIVQALCGEDWRKEKLFVVGDFKQSIYGFRGAEPEVSSRLREELPPESRLSLTTNFRSQPAILDFVNSLFVDSFGEGYEPLVANRDQTTPEPAIEFLWSPVEIDEAGKKDTADEARKRGAEWIARRLVELLESGEPIIGESDSSEKGGNSAGRPLRLGDIAVLVRAMGDVQVYEEAFRRHGLEYYLAGGHAFYAQQEIYDVLNLLKAVESVADEVALAGALRSPFFSLQDETLFWLVEKSRSLNEGLYAEQPPQELSANEQAKCLRAGVILRRLRAQKNERLVADLLLEAFSLTGYDASLTAEFLGHRKWANVQKLVEQARTHDRNAPGDLAGFITQLGEFVVRAPKEPLAATQSEGDVIRIMTIHNSKGLEFPLVVLPDLERKQPVIGHAPVFDQSLGPLVASKEKEATVGHDLYRNAQQRREQQERDRVFYVACTRAADYLLLSSSVADLERPQQDSLKLLASRFDLATGELRSELPVGYATPRIRVTTDEPELTGKLVGAERGSDLSKTLAEVAQQLPKQTLGELSTSPTTELPPTKFAASINPERYSFSRLSG
ncbi:MAG: UvrD-helicase domain-containing protein, partial [Lacipirellulaceae bacterium]